MKAFATLVMLIQVACIGLQVAAQNYGWAAFHLATILYLGFDEVCEALRQ